MTIPDTAVEAIPEAIPGTNPEIGPETVLETRPETRLETRPEANTGPAARTTSQSVPRTTPRSVLLLGATGRTGGRVLKQLLDRGISVRAIVRSAARLPVGAGPRRVPDEAAGTTAAGTTTAAAGTTTAGGIRAAAGTSATAAAPLTVVEGDIAAMQPADLRRHLQGCDTVISCLGHAPNLRGVYGPPRDLVEGAVRAVCEAAASLKPTSPIRLILMSSVSVNRPARADTRRGAGERAFVGLVRALVPPARDNQRAADYLACEIGEDHPFVSWVVVRPDSLVEGEASAYRANDGLVASLFRPDKTRMANVARFMAELTSNEVAWRRWRGKMPVIVDETAEGTNE